jgi:hypothetical protein
VFFFESLFPLKSYSCLFFKGLFVFFKINLKDIIEDARIDWYIHLISLIWILDKVEELADTQQVESLRDPQELVEFLLSFVLTIETFSQGLISFWSNILTFTISLD